MQRKLFYLSTNFKKPDRFYLRISNKILLTPVIITINHIASIYKSK